jgi:putative transposase
LYEFLGLTRQAVQQMAERYHKQLLKSQQFIEKAIKIRRRHPELGCRKMAIKLQDGSFGRDKIEHLLITSGFRVMYSPNYIKTTRSIHQHRFANLVEGLVIKGINKVVQTDITYFWMNGRFGYLVFIIDVYSKLIVGYNASFGLEASANISALEMMIRLRGKENVKRLIHHSDRGSQYHCTKYLELLKEHKIKISMCNEAWENAYAERINRTIKNEYLRHRQINTLTKLKKQLSIDVKAYNTDRPHRNLPGQMAPATFEEYLSRLQKSKRPEVKIYKTAEENKKNEFFLAIRQSDNKIAAME